MAARLARDKLALLERQLAELREDISNNDACAHRRAVAAAVRANGARARPASRVRVFASPPPSPPLFCSTSGFTRPHHHPRSGQHCPVGVECEHRRVCDVQKWCVGALGARRGAQHIELHVHSRNAARLRMQGAITLDDRVEFTMTKAKTHEMSTTADNAAVVMVVSAMRSGSTEFVRDLSHALKEMDATLGEAYLASRPKERPDDVFATPQHRHGPS